MRYNYWGQHYCLHFLQMRKLNNPEGWMICPRSHLQYTEVRICGISVMSHCLDTSCTHIPVSVDLYLTVSNTDVDIHLTIVLYKISMNNIISLCKLVRTFLVLDESVSIKSSYYLLFTDFETNTWDHLSVVIVVLFSYYFIHDCLMLAWLNQPFAILQLFILWTWSWIPVTAWPRARMWLLLSPTFYLVNTIYLQRQCKKAEYACCLSKMLTPWI